MRCHECRKSFKPNRSDKVFHTKNCRSKYFNRKAKIAMAIMEKHAAGDHKGAIAVYQDWQVESDRRAKQ